MNKWDENIQSISLIIGIALLVLLGFMGLGKAINLLTFPEHIAKIEQVREAVDRVGCSSVGTLVIARAVDTNLTIITWQVANQRPFFGFAIPDEWNNVETIKIPLCK